MGNIASGNERVAVQVGRVASGDGSKGKSSTKRDKNATGGRTVNVRSGNARVGRQVDEVHGDLNI